MNRKLARVHEIALEVRSWAENEADKASRAENLMGYCAIASAELFKRLEKEGLAAEIHLSQTDWGSHVYLVIEDHIVDVTATQYHEFSATPVVIIHYKEAEQHEFYETSEIFWDVKALRKFQTNKRWPNDQIAYR